MKRLFLTCFLILMSSCSGGQRSQDFREIVQQAKDKVFPAVVFIRVMQESHESGEKITQEVSGSGVIVDAEGHVITNQHVIEKAVQVRCLLYNGESYEAEVIGEDKDTDLGLIRLVRPEGDVTPFPVASIGDSRKLVEGDFVMAMGAPFGLSRSVSVGIVSCTKRYLEGSSEYNLWLQTDASISPGNSGGPLVNTLGEVIGINSMILRGGGDLGLSVPSHIFMNVINQLREHQAMQWTWTGIHITPLRDFNKDITYEYKNGVIVADVDRQSPAEMSGLLPEDRIIQVNGQAVTAATEEDLPRIRRLLGTLSKEAPSTLTVVRDEKTVSLEMVPREKGAVEGEELDCPRWDFTVKEINQFDNPDLYFHREKGVFIFALKEPGNALMSRMQEQDILLKIGDQDIHSIEDVKKVHEMAIENVNTVYKLLFTIFRNGEMRQVVLDFERDFEKE